MCREQSHITIPELVKKLAVPPKKRTNGDRKLIADALYVFISSIAPFKEGLHAKLTCFSAFSLCAACAFIIYSTFQFLMHQIEICIGFLKSDANEVAKRAELRTVDANQTVFRQGFVCFDFVSVKSFLIRVITFVKNYWCTECSCLHSNTTCRRTRKRILLCFARICGYPNWNQDSQGMLTM